MSLALTLGDPAGIGPEILLKALAHLPSELLGQFFIAGTGQVLEETYARLCQQGQVAIDPAQLQLWEHPLDEVIVPGRPSVASGTASFAYLKTAIQRAIAGEVAGIVTAPISKACWQAAGYSFPGQTEVLAHLTGTAHVGMLFLGRSPVTHWVLTTLLATTHIPLQAVPRALTPEGLNEKLALLIQFLRERRHLERPRIAIAGLNPHSGEQGHLGQEEVTWLIPWLAAAQQQYPEVELIGPVPPDTLWIGAADAWWGRPAPATAYDAYLALYHDQGLIPVKMLAFREAVNTTIGLPFIRTSPDHGTAFDIAGTGVADPQSFLAAIAWAQTLSKGSVFPLTLA
ncbi:4-hydroxythreonine-4-phosphate dehydrogenase PdxA [Thermosynechococcus vestitus]|uniref:4-hydroxythreonine-4-phosphate dehydrogenase n=1 Tax=Thermosynechococcus vestitus (strain NIES-2133 / IAM M-273 / BP-1) TaxID=197221 RepID=PDXA_THEVB|nr:4-hydroxythreonine-4-phosphate dehydrogenase PdxA [Thermosynechococcus vestitus]Q8DHB4.1 RecName: Full=4-hydroxythreonine-4-phosphate dehydrogenase; AltName: Full=4-(phosphohydroxy)-L-threonine dehydrogenase [Thermosynechococcus vestitus BP-1]BAC09597.1 pyridoxal phosphate biosynthetic protein [Thermosynechococcus vestitus BP-1]